MAKIKPQDVQDEINKQEPFNSGSDTISSHSPSPDSDDDTSQALEDVLGNPPKHSGNIGDEINNDEQKIAKKPINDYQPEEPEPVATQNELDAAEVPDPFDLLTDADFKKKKSSK